MRNLSVVMLLLMSTMHRMTGNPPFREKASAANVMTYMLKIQQVKERILRGLNMTTAPHRSPSTRMLLTPDSSKVKVKKQLEIAESQPNISMILSESADDGHLNTMSFKLDSRARAIVQDIDVAVLVVHLRSNSDGRDKGQPAWNLTALTKESDYHIEIRDNKNKKHDFWNITEPGVGLDNLVTTRSRGRRGRRKNKNIEDDDKTITTNKPDLGRNNSESVIKRDYTNSEKEDPLKQSGKKTLRKPRDLKPRRVKVVVKAIDQATGKKRRIAVEKVIVKRTRAMAVPVGKDVLVNAASSSNHALLLQMTCKRCQGRVQIEQVYKSVPKKNKQQRRKIRLNPNRPYLFIRSGANEASPRVGDTDQMSDTASNSNQFSRSRSKRRSDIINTFRKTFTPGKIPSICCSQRHSVSFQELGLNFIIHPTNLSLRFCFRSCQTYDIDSLKNSSLSHQKDSRFKMRDSPRKMENRNCQSDLKFRLSETSRKPIEVNANNVPKEVQSRNVSPSSNQCHILMIEPVDVMYLDDSNKVHNRRLPAELDESCECQDRR